MKRVLVIEDDEDLRSDLITVLEFEGYEAIGAENGQQGVLMARQHLPDLIICDVTMPVLDGFEVIMALHQNLQTAAIPVIFLSARSDKAAIERGMRLGAAAYVRKPYSLKGLLAAVGTHLC
ncbi:MAG: response regulator [Pseudorhodoplanes sp.]|nr:response regulator [Pseudorhodoplanes sp.]